MFLTVNSLAKVYWDGTFEKRRLELNWVNPPDVQRADYVGLFRVDPQWFGISGQIGDNVSLTMNINLILDHRAPCPRAGPVPRPVLPDLGAVQ